MCYNTQSCFIHKNIDSHSFPAWISSPSLNVCLTPTVVGLVIWSRMKIMRLLAAIDNMHPYTA
jgi:hypothetical protein